MSDQRFNDRLKRIEKRARGGPKPEIMAGVGDVKQARKAAIGEPFPFLSMVLGAVSGFAALYSVQQQLGLSDLQALVAAPAEAVVLAQENPVLGASGVCLALICTVFLLALMVRGIGSRVHAFAFTGVAGALAAVAASLTDPDKLMALIATYTSQLPV